MAEEALKPQAQLHSEFEAELNLRRARRGSLDMAAREQAATDMAKAIANLVVGSSENQDEGAERRPRRASYLLRELDSMESELRPTVESEKKDGGRKMEDGLRPIDHLDESPSEEPPPVKMRLRARSMPVPPVSGRRPLVPGAGEGGRSGMSPHVDEPARSEAEASSNEVAAAAKGAVSRTLGKAGGRFGIGSSRTPRASREDRLPSKERPSRRSKDSVIAADIDKSVPFR